MAGTTSSIQRHYRPEDLVGRILGALEVAGHDTDHPTVEMLNLIGQLHGRGLASTKAQTALVGVTGDMRVPDAECGVVGPSCYPAHTFGCPIEAIERVT